jgi:hypothetical protein
MGFINQNFNPGNDTGIGSSLSGLSDGLLVASPPLPNTFNEITATIQVTVTMSADGTNTNGSIACYISRSLDGTNFDDNSNQPQAFNLAPLSTFSVDSTSSNTYVFSMDAYITGTLPSTWIFVIFNNSGGTIASGSAMYCLKEYYAF